MSQPHLIPIEQLIRRSDTRLVSEANQEALEDSIAEVGLLNPLTVRELPDGMFEIIAGSHRYAACDNLGHRDIPCHVVEMDDLRAEIAMIDENLYRAELSPSDRARQIARRKAIYEELHPQTVAGNNQHTRVGQLGQPNFAEATAAAIGASERAVRRDAERGEKVIEEVLDMVRGTKLDTGIYLDKLKKLPPNEQVHAAKRDLTISRHQDRESAAEKIRRDLKEPARTASAVKEAPAAAPKPTSSEGYIRFVALSDGFSQLEATAIVAGIPSANQRADLRNRVRSLLAFLETLDDLMEGSRHA